MPLLNEAAPTEETATEEEEEVVMPVGGVDTGGGGTAGLERTSLLIAGGLALVVGAAGLALAARRPARD